MSQYAALVIIARDYPCSKNLNDSKKGANTCRVGNLLLGCLRLGL